MNADQLRTRMAQLPRPETTLKPPYWQAWRLELYDWILANDPAKFWQCPAVYHTMLVAHWQNAIKFEFIELIPRLRMAIDTPHIGPDDHFQGTSLSMNLIHQAYHILQWEQATDRRIDELDTVIEFGGGYGAMALLCRRLGFKGKYVIYDLPEFSLLQEYYLSQLGIDGIEWNPKRKPKGVDLFMALYSLSEVPPDDRDKLVVRANSYLFLYSGQWEAWNNVEWFKQFAASTSLNWQHTEIDHLPDRENWYSIG